MATLIVCALASFPLQAQTAHYGAIVTLGSGFATPTGVAVDAYGNVFVADNGNSAVKEILAVNGKIPPSPTINTLGSGFANPFTVAVDGSGNVYVTDYGNHEVKEIEAVNGSIPSSPTIRILGGGFGYLFGSAVDGHGDVFVTDYGRNEVKEILAVNGVIPASPKILSLGSGFNIPAGVALDGSGNLFIGDQNNDVVKEILASSGYTTTNTVAAGFSTPDGVAVDKYGDVFVADDGNNLVKEVLAVNGVIPPSPNILTVGSGFAQPFDVAVDGSGNVYVADRGHNAVEEIQMAGANFGQVNVGTTTLSPITLSFTFDTGGTLGSTAVVTTGTGGLDFYDAGGGTCVANTVYSAGAVCTVNVKFGPLAPGPRYGAVELLSTTGTLLALGRIQGTGVGPQATFANTTHGSSLPSSTFKAGSGFSSPGGVAVDASGNIFVGDTYNNSVKEILAAGGWTTVHALGAGFSCPNGVAVDGGGNVYVADTCSDSVKEIVAAGGYTTVNTLGSGFANPFGVAVDGTGNVFVADFSNDAVKEILAVGGSIPASPAIRTLAGGINGPDGVAVDGNGNVFVASYYDDNVKEIVAVNGTVPASPTVKTIGSGFNGPANLSVDGFGNVFVSDSYNGVVDEIVAAGGFITVKALGTGFSFPDAVAVISSGDVVVADGETNLVQMMDFADPPSLTFASTPVGATSSDSPQTVTVSNDGNAALVFPLPASGTNPSVSANFPWNSASTCLQTNPASPQAFQLAGGASCTMAFNFKPTSTGTIGGSAILTDNNLNLTNNTQTISLSGVGTANATLSSPTPGSVLVGPKVTFSWSPVSGATSYNLRIGTTVGGNNVYGSGNITTTSTTPTNLPTNGETLYVRLYMNYAAGQVYNDYIYTAATAAALSSPTPSTTLAGNKITFTWTTGTGATGYGFRVGTSVGGNDAYSSGTITTTSTTPTNLPTNGETLYARLYTDYSNGSQSYTDYTFTAPTAAALTSPLGGATLGTSQAFTWSAGTGTSYSFRLGTTVGGNNLYGSGVTTHTTVTANSLPSNGETVYGRLYTTYTNGSQSYIDYTFTAAP